jgi:hypothetical protein
MPKKKEANGDDVLVGEVQPGANRLFGTTSEHGELK